MEQQIHGTEPDHRMHDVGAMQSLVVEVIVLLADHLAEMLHDVEKHGDQEAAGAAGGLDHRFPSLGSQTLDDPVDQRSGCEVLAGAALGIAGIAFQQAFVGIALDVGAEDDPALLIGTRSGIGTLRVAHANLIADQQAIKDAATDSCRTQGCGSRDGITPPR
jgi:hypothetical protein